MFDFEDMEVTITRNYDIWSDESEKVYFLWSQLREMGFGQTYCGPTSFGLKGVRLHKNNDYHAVVFLSDGSIVADCWNGSYELPVERYSKKELLESLTRVPLF